MEDPGAALAAFRVAAVTAAVQHPNADRLRVCTVEAGGEPVTVVCGAPNARAGMRAVFAPPGSHIPGLNTVLKMGEIRGVQSAGMLLSFREMGLGEEHDGIADLPQDAPVGMPYPAYAGLDDPVIDIAVTPNRGDALAVRGVARDLAAAGLGTLRPWSAAPACGAVPLPDHLAHRDAGLPVGAGPHCPRRAQRAEPGMAATAPAVDRAAADQRAGRHHELLHPRHRPAAARVRRGPGAGRRAGRPARRRRDVPCPERPRLHGDGRRIA